MFYLSGALGRDALKNARMYRQTDAELAQHINQSVKTIEGMCSLFDNGNTHIAFSLATEIQKVLTTGQHVVQVRGDMLFPTINFDYSRRNLAPEHKLIAVSLFANSDQDPPYYVDFVIASKNDSASIKWLHFRDWWNKDIVYRAGASAPGTPAGVFPTDERLHVPKSKREAFTRRLLIQEMRNKFGAHLDREIPEALRLLQTADALGISIGVNVGGAILNTHDGTLPMKTAPSAAMVRQIAHEVLEAFLRKNQS
jgi:hypothetical protein